MNLISHDFLNWLAPVGTVGTISQNKGIASFLRWVAPGGTQVAPEGRQHEK
jgi:hypothetical protein